MNKKKSNSKKAVMIGCGFVGSASVFALMQSGLFTEIATTELKISVKDRYIFFRKNFKKEHSLFMIYRKGIWNIKEWSAYFYAKKKCKFRTKSEIVKSTS